MNPIVTSQAARRTAIALFGLTLALAAARPATADVTRPATQVVRAPAGGAAPVYAYDGAADAQLPAEALPQFGETPAYAPFEPEHAARPPARHESLLARARRAASRILSLTRSLPRF